ncbi:MAG: aspartate aminotransferase [Candidatus Diapherotrites archaeon]|jgi:perosamine synthetase|uniref:Aspartate aminotransferase n=1 Tax=Candidatus Iainarchaeum sp. TaxID=3101447 RepID=A0A8T5GE33_9ARCH|nr:aspartate aminotransferase [Candidatus Diapherotrites archaeon]MBT7241506.1 aspartate aminotransferase [Candidatus Diapherotrites archaeon]
MKISDKYLIDDPLELKYLEEALKQKKLSGTSDLVKKYEEELATYFKSKYAIATSSGTASLICAVQEVASKGDEIILPSTIPLMTAYPLLLLGIKPVFCDSEKSSLGLDETDLSNKITKKTKAVINVPMWGYPIDYSKQQKIIEENDLVLIEDAAQAHGAKLCDKFVGTIGKMGCFSTQDRKILPTGEGGFILTDDKKMAEGVRKYSCFGFMNGIDFGLNFKLSGLQSALGRARIKQIDSQIRIRTKNANYITKNINSDKIRELKIPSESSPNYYSLLLEINTKDNAAFIQKLSDKGIPSDILKYDQIPLYEKEIFTPYKTNCSNAKSLLKNITTIPVHPGLGEEELEYIVKTINNTIEDF